MKHRNVAIIGAGDAGSLVISSLYQKPVETLGGIVVVEMSRPAELKVLGQLIEIELVNNIDQLGLRFIEEPKVAPWPKDRLLVKGGRVNTKGFGRRGVNRPGRR